MDLMELYFRLPVYETRRVEDHRRGKHPTGSDLVVEEERWLAKHPLSYKFRDRVHQLSDIL